MTFPTPPHRHIDNTGGIDRTGGIDNTGGIDTTGGIQRKSINISYSEEDLRLDLTGSNNSSRITEFLAGISSRAALNLSVDIPGPSVIASSNDLSNSNKSSFTYDKDLKRGGREGQTALNTGPKSSGDPSQQFGIWNRRPYRPKPYDNRIIARRPSPNDIKIGHIWLFVDAPDEYEYTWHRYGGTGRIFPESTTYFNGSEYNYGIGNGKNWMAQHSGSPVVPEFYTDAVVGEPFQTYLWEHLRTSWQFPDPSLPEFFSETYYYRADFWRVYRVDGPAIQRYLAIPVGGDTFILIIAGFYAWHQNRLFGSAKWWHDISYNCTVNGNYCESDSPYDAPYTLLRLINNNLGSLTESLLGTMPQGTYDYSDYIAQAVEQITDHGMYKKIFICNNKGMREIDMPPETAPITKWLNAIHPELVYEEDPYFYGSAGNFYYGPPGSLPYYNSDYCGYPLCPSNVPAVTSRPIVYRWASPNPYWYDDNDAGFASGGGLEVRGAKIFTPDVFNLINEDMYYYLGEYFVPIEQTPMWGDVADKVHTVYADFTVDGYKELDYPNPDSTTVGKTLYDNGLQLKYRYLKKKGYPSKDYYGQDSGDFTADTSSCPKATLRFDPLRPGKTGQADTSTTYGSAELLCVYDWNDPEYCKGLCLKLGFKPADLVP